MTETRKPFGSRPAPHPPARTPLRRIACGGWGDAEHPSTVPTRPEEHTRTLETPPQGTRSVSWGLPSRDGAGLVRARSHPAPERACNASPLRNSTPISAARPVTQPDRVGRGRGPSREGTGDDEQPTHPATSAEGSSAASGPTARARRRPLAPRRPSPAGTNQSVTRSTRPWIGSLAPWASSTMRMICASVVSAPTRAARKVRLPQPLTLPPVTLSPSDLPNRHRLPGDHAFIDMARPGSRHPSPSAGTRSPEPDDQRCRRRRDPRRRCRRFPRPCSTRAVRGSRPRSASIAAPVRPLARASSQRPTEDQHDDDRGGLRNRPRARPLAVAPAGKCRHH